MEVDYNMVNRFAIIGHDTRGNEIIEILESLGGKNTSGFTGKRMGPCVYYIDNLNKIRCRENAPSTYVVLTIDQFINKFPYKIGAKVLCKGHSNVHTIAGISRNSFGNLEYDITEDKTGITTHYPTKLLQPYEEETFGECIEKTINECLFESDEDTMVKENYSPVKLLPLGSKVMIVPTNEDSEIIEENGKFYLVKKQQQYPKTYEECCEVLFPNSIELGKVLTSGYNCELLKTLGELLICRDTYWKLAGWNPKVKSDVFYMNTLPSYLRDLFPMPTEEMRYVFYENFKDLINQCKELL
jgi:hypothetical protein